MNVRPSLRARAAWHEIRCRECRVSWRSWWRRLRDQDLPPTWWVVGESDKAASSGRTADPAEGDER